jgi:signal transduction histidine kinase/DNA-binding NarL/FixJ family response regulator
MSGSCLPRAGAGSVYPLCALLVVLQCLIQTLTGQPLFELGHPEYQFFSSRDYGIGDQNEAEYQNCNAVQDKEGLLLFGGSNSVLAYDGRQWEHIPVPGAFGIGGLAADSHGGIWVGGFDKLGNLVQEGERYHFVSMKPVPGLPAQIGRVMDIVTCGDAEYVRTQKALLVLQGGGCLSIEWPHGNGLDFRLSATSKRVFIHSRNDPLYEIADGRLVPIVDDERVRSTVVLTVLEPVPGLILLVTSEQGIFRLKQNGIEAFPTNIDPLLTRSPIQAATCSGSNIAVAIEQHGVALLNRQGKLLCALFEENGLPYSNIINLGSDRAGGLWICGSAGLTRVGTRSCISFFDAQNGLPRSMIGKVRLFRGRIYAATWDGLFGLETATPETLVASFRKIPGTTTPISVFADTGKELLAGGWKGLFSFDGSQLKQIPISIDRIYALTPSKTEPNLVYIGCEQGLAVITKKEGYWRLDGVRGNFGSGVIGVFEANAGDVFVATRADGFFRVRFESGSPRIFDKIQVSSLADAENAPKSRDPNELTRLGGEIAFVSQRGILRYDADKNRFAPVADYESIFRTYQPTNAIYSSSDRKQIWIAMRPREPDERGVQTARIARLESGGRISMLPAAITRTIGDPQSIEEETSGESSILWIAGAYGIARVKVGEALSPSGNFKVFPREATTASGTPVALPLAGGLLKLPFDLRDIQIRFANDHFAAPDQIRYRLRLEGREKNWGAPLSDPLWRSGSLSEGRYRLHAVAEDEDGVKSDETTLAIEILPPWYRTWWMYAIYGALCVLCVLGFVRLRVWRLRVREKELVAIVTERTKELEESQAKLVEAKEAAEAANRAKSTFLANVSHELRTPLNSILGYTQLMLRDQNQPQEKRRRLTTILSSGEHLLNMINEILDLAKVESGTITIKVQPVQLKPLLNSLADEFQLRANQKQLRFTYSSDHSVQEWISTDPIRLKQVLYNLVGNSIKFTEKGEVALRVSRIKDRIRIEVRDTGRGIPGDEIQHLCKPFYQATNNDQAGGGVGLGLFISQRVVRLLGGVLEVSSKEGEGSNFWFELPIGLVNAALAPCSRQKVVRLEGKSAHILVVDDDAANREYMLDLLQEVGLSATFAPSAAAALELMRTEKFDCVVSDIRMAGLTGIEFCRELRKDPQFALLPMIASSASVYENDREKALAAGFNAFVPKPISEATLFGLFESLLELKPVYRSDAESEAEFDGAEDAMNRPLTEALPDTQRIDELLAHAKLGDIMALRAAIRKLSEKNLKLHTFSRRLSVLAEQYQMSAVEKILLKASELAESERSRR